jgi:hypothetical protein
VVIVRSGSGQTWHTLSAKHGADIEVSLHPDECDALFAALQQATKQARQD